MKNVMTIAKRELRTYFESPIGYIFAIVFLLILTSLFISGFFIYPRAEMRGFFNHLPIVLCIFIPAVSMRLWAEDRKENTWEMLLTLPMKAWELTLGKFIAALLFYCIALAGTLTIPIMLSVLGAPDFGPIFGAYLGSMLLGAIFLAMGIFFSALVADQIVAFVLSLMSSFTLFLLGTDLISAVLDGSWDGLGTFLSKVLGVTKHFNSFAKGVFELGDILYFAVWIVVFLFLNTIYIDGRMREGHKKNFAVTVILCIAIGLSFNWIIADTSLMRVDLTEDKIYTVSDATQRILTSLDTPVQITLYITAKDKMPTQLRDMEADIMDKLQEIDLASGGYIDYKAVHMEASNALAAIRNKIEGGEEKEKNEKDNLIEKRMLDKGVQPFNIQALEADQVITKFIYSSIGIAYKDRPEEFIPQVIPQSLDNLEYNLMNIVYKISRDHKPTIALVAPKQDIKINPQLAMLYQQMGRPVPRSEDPYAYLEKFLEVEKYVTHRVKISQREHLPEEYDTLVVTNPEEFTERQKWEVSRALHEGKNVIIAVQTEEWNYQLQRNTMAINKKEIKPQINDLLAEYGIEVVTDSLMDMEHQPLTVMDRSNPMAQLTGQGLTLDLPIQVVVNPETMNKNVAITAKLSQIGYMWGSALKLDDKKLAELGLKKTILISSSKDSWTTKTSQQLVDEDVRTPEERAKQGDKSGMELGPFPLAVLIEGQFPAGYSAKSRPQFRNEPVDPQMARFQPPTPEDTPVTEAKPATGKLIVIGCSTLFRKEFMNEGGRDFFINAVDSLTLSNDLVEIRGKKRTDRSFAKPSDSSRAMWKFIVLALVPLILAFWGIYGSLSRQRARDVYTMKFSN